MKRDLPDWQPFDPGAAPAGTAPVEGRVVIVAPTARAQEGGWAGRATVDLARRWGGEGRKVFLADVSLARPTLHEFLGTPNNEGIADAVLYGASVRRVALTSGEPFFFAPAGTPVGDPAEVLGHRRWEDLAHGFSSAGATLLLYTPLDLDGAAELMLRATEVVVLAAPDETLDLDGNVAERVTAVWGPPAEEPAASPAEGAGPPVDATEPVEPAPERTRPGPGRPGGRRTRRRSGSRVELLVLLLVLVLGGVVVGSYYGYLDVPWLSSFLAEPAEQPADDASPAAGDVPGEEPAGAPAGDDAAEASP